MGEGYLTTDASVETVSSFEVFAEEIQRVASDAYRWKWAIIALHSGLQGMMVLALQSSHGLHTLRPEDATRWLEAHERGGPYPEDLKLDDFLALYKKIKSKLMIMYVHSQRFVPKGSQGGSVKFLNSLRNEYIHFTPRVWVLELAGLPKMAEDCLEAAEFLAWESHNIFWEEDELCERFKRAFEAAHTALLPLRKKRRNG